MRPKPLPSRAKLCRLFFYAPSTGVLSWRLRPSPTKANRIFNKVFAGKPAGRTDLHGYVVLELYGNPFKAHRVIWKIMTGKDPEWIDHRDGDRANNRWPNLRNATQAQNSYNGNLSPKNTSGYRGVSFIRAHGKYRAAVQVNGRKQHIGYFSRAEDAQLAAARVILATRGEFARLA
jgi:hypothetical protein